jgi:hypothetical protein
MRGELCFVVNAGVFPASNLCALEEKAECGTSHWLSVYSAIRAERFFLEIPVKKSCVGGLKSVSGLDTMRSLHRRRAEMRVRNWVGKSSRKFPKTLDDL